MNKIILHPGNGVNFPKCGDYVKLNLVVYDNNKTVFFDSRLLSEHKSMEIRYKYQDSNILSELEDLIGEMSLFEKCLLICDKSSGKTLDENEYIQDLIKINKEIIFEVEIIDINKNSFY